MSYKHHRSRSHSLVNKREHEPDRNIYRLQDYEREINSYERQHPYNPHFPLDLPTSIDGIINNVETYPPIVQMLVREIFMERKQRQLVKETLNIREHNHILLRTQYDQLVNEINLLKRDYNQCRNNLRNISMDLNELQYYNHQLREYINRHVNDKQQRRY